MPRGGRRLNAGRPQGSKSVRPTMREAFQQAFDTLQDGPQALPEWGRQNPTEFYKVAVRLVPQKIEADVTLTLESLVAGSLGKKD